MNRTEEKSNEIVKMLQESGLSFDDQIQVIRIAREILEARRLKIVMKDRKEPKVIDVIREKIEAAIRSNAKPKVLMVSKDIERLMFLDESFPKSENFIDKIKVDDYELDFIVIERNNLINILAILN